MRIIPNEISRWIVKFGENERSVTSHGAGAAMKKCPSSGKMAGDPTGIIVQTRYAKDVVADARIEQKCAIRQQDQWRTK